jgi:hypothetical protein
MLRMWFLLCQAKRDIGAQGLIQTEVYKHIVCIKVYYFTDPEADQSSLCPHRLFPCVPFTVIPISFFTSQVTALQSGFPTKL